MTLSLLPRGSSVHSFSWIATERFRRVQQICVGWLNLEQQVLCWKRGWQAGQRQLGCQQHWVCAAVEISPCRSARKQADALNMSDRSVRQISQFKIHFYLFIQIGYCSAIKKNKFFQHFLFWFLLTMKKKICRTNGWFECWWYNFNVKLRGAFSSGRVRL